MDCAPRKFREPYDSDVKCRNTNWFIVLSLALFIVAFAMWIRSYWFADFTGRYDGKGGSFGLTSCMGSIQAHLHRTGYGNVSGYYLRRDWADKWGKLGDTFDFSIGFARDRFWIKFPYWLLCVIFALLPVPFVYARRRRLRDKGCCTACGYDLKGDFEHGCPECGSNRQPLT